MTVGRLSFKQGLVLRFRFEDSDPLCIKPVLPHRGETGFFLYTVSMSEALYRKYRPHMFDDVVGQDHIVSVLKQALKDESVSHAYLFSGSRGLGKTSIARILARELGIQGRDVYEIDAASNRGIDDIRALREEINLLPYESPYKIYILDEVHMLSREAFNALLKTLEEPPAHAKFVLATTEKHKLPETIVSRCEVHEFKKPTLTTLSSYVDEVAKKEDYELEDGVSRQIALIGQGSFRDTLGALQKVSSSVKGKKITLEDIQSITGVPQEEKIFELLENIAQGDVDAALERIRGAGEGASGMDRFVLRLIELVRLVLLVRYSKNIHKDIQEEVGEETFKRLQDLAKEKGINSKLLSRLLDVAEEDSFTSIPELPLELALIDILGDK